MAPSIVPTLVLIGKQNAKVLVIDAISTRKTDKGTKAKGQKRT